MDLEKMTREIRDEWIDGTDDSTEVSDSDDERFFQVVLRALKDVAKREYERGIRDAIAKLNSSIEHTEEQHREWMRTQYNSMLLEALLPEVKKGEQP